LVTAKDQIAAIYDLIKNISRISLSKYPLFRLLFPGGVFFSV